MRTEDLRRLEDSVLTVANRLDAVIDDNFVIDGVIAPDKNVVGVCRKLTNAWREMDEALDEIKSLIKEPTRLGDQTDPDEAVPDIDRETFKELLQKVTPESLQAANKAAVFFREKLDDEEGLKLSKECQAAFMATMLFEYGKLTASKKEVAQAADPEEKEGD